MSALGRGPYLRLLAAAGTVAGADQLTKHLALNALPGTRTFDIVEGAITLRVTYNSGGAFGLLQGFPGLFLVATAVVVVMILVWARRLDDRRWAIPLGMVLGGGVGNVVDRVVRDTPGVVDFIDLHVWPVFNLADMAIVVGVGLVLLLSASPGRREAPDRDTTPGRSAGA